MSIAPIIARQFYEIRKKWSDWALQSRFIFHWIHVVCIPKIRPLVKRTVKAIASRLYVSRKSVSPDADYLDYQEEGQAMAKTTLFSSFRREKETFYASDLPRSARASDISIDIYLAKCFFTEKYTHAYTHTHSLTHFIDNSHNSIAAGRNACDISTCILHFDFWCTSARDCY